MSRPKGTWESRNRYKMINTHSRALPELWQKFKQLARENNRPANSALGLLIAEAVKHWKLPNNKTQDKARSSK